MGASFAAHASWVFVSLLLSCFIVVSQSAASWSEVLSSLKGNGSSSWNTSNPDPCSWKGVTCTSNEVRNISLAGMGLSGQILPNISLLKGLVQFDASNNTLTGTIPAEMSECLALLTVNLTLNKLSGQIPTSLGKLEKLQVLDLSQNLLHGSIPEELGNLKALQKLSLDSNNLNGTIIRNLSGLSLLTDLSLSRNSLSDEIPKGIAELHNLENFLAYQNNLQGPIPPMSMRALKLVNLGSNMLSGPIPANMCLWGQLKVLTLSTNQLNGAIPEDLGSCQSLSTLRLEGNFLDGSIPDSFGKLQNLVYFVANNNNLTGQLPSDLSGWKNLSLLNLAGNSLSGKLPIQLSEAASLQELVLSNNSFEGPIPPELAQCKSLSVLRLGTNRLTGSVPSNLCSLPLLATLALESNSLSGEIPLSIGECARLLELHLGDNGLIGSIPAQVGNLSSLQVSLNLSLNALTGTIPDSLGQLEKLVSLDVSHNQLTGIIPASVQSMVSLLDWNFSNNQLTGAIPIRLANSSANGFINNSLLCGDPLQSCTGASSALTGRRNAHTFWKAAGIAIACAVVLLLLISFIVIVVMHKHYFRAAVDPAPPVPVSRFFSEDMEHAVDFERIKEATSSNANIISTNHFSTVYKAMMPSGIVLAAKKLNSSEKGLVFQQRKLIFELDKMWRFSHENIMQPMGFFLEDDLAIIVYSFVPSCSLSQKLHRNYESMLPWPSRYKIAIAAAQGLTFLHHYCNPPMMHMDVSSNNIFLGSNLEVKVGDVEVAKLLDPTKHTGSISAVAGSFGYIAPEYAFTMRVTLASNIYSFGVVLLELLTGRRPVDEFFGDGLDLVRWVHGASSRGEMPEQILDARISTQSFASRQEMLSVLKVAILCTNVAPLKRPRMKKVLEALQEAKLQ